MDECLSLYKANGIVRVVKTKRLRRTENGREVI
jgi:hypothetical protein